MISTFGKDILLSLDFSIFDSRITLQPLMLNQLLQESLENADQTNKRLVRVSQK
jgi:hypothetical protein